MKNKFAFILVKPQLGENIGACARSLKNFGFSKLNIVSPKQAWPNNKAKSTSVGAFDIIKKTKVFNNTYNAIDDYDVVVSLSARKRDINKKHISINQFLKIIKTKKNTKFALMFGPEASGLSNDDLSLSNYVLQIPTSKLLDKKGFFVPAEKKHSMIMNINNLFYRLEPNDKEVRILASIISSLVKKNINHN